MQIGVRVPCFGVLPGNVLGGDGVLSRVGYGENAGEEGGGEGFRGENFVDVFAAGRGVCRVGDGA